MTTTPAHRHQGDQLAHRVDSGAVPGLLVATTHPSAGGHRPGLGDAHQLQRQVAIPAHVQRGVHRSGHFKCLSGEVRVKRRPVTAGPDLLRCRRAWRLGLGDSAASVAPLSKTLSDAIGPARSGDQGIRCAGRWADAPKPRYEDCLSKTSGRDVAGGDADPLFGQRDPFDHFDREGLRTDLSTPRGANVTRERERNVTVNGS